MSAPDTMATLVRLGGGLLAVIALVFVSAKLARRVRGQTGTSGLRVIDRVVLSREAHLAVVEAGGRRLLLGVTAQRVSLVGSLQDGETLDAVDDAALAGLALPDHEVPAQPGQSEQPEHPEQLERLERLEQPEQRAQPVETEQPSYGTPPPAEVSAVPRQRRPGRRELLLDDQPAIDAQPPTRRSLRAAQRAEEAAAEPTAEPTAEPAAEPASQPAAEQLAPAGLNLSDHPDLASALRAAGRTVRPTPIPPAPARPQTRVQAQVTHAAAAAEAAETAAAQALLEASRTGSQGMNRSRPANGAQGSGSVLSPATWKQGIEALREFTVRRG